MFKTSTSIMLGAAALLALPTAAMAVDGQGEDFDAIPALEDATGVPVNRTEVTLTENDREEAHTATAPSLAVSSGNGDECQGSFSVGAQVVFAGISGGATVDIPDCQGLRSSRLAFDMASRIPGMEYAAVGILCQLNDGRNVGPINAALAGKGLDCNKLMGAPEPLQQVERQSTEQQVATFEVAAIYPKRMGTNK